MPALSPTIIPERTDPLISTIGQRLGAGFVALVCLGVLVVSSSISPNPEGHATHTQLGMPPCPWVVWFDQPCATCGMTTAYAHAADASWFTAFKTQPAGALLALLTSIIFWGATHQALLGSRIGSVAIRAVGPRSITIGLVLIGLAWVYKIATWTGA